MPIAPASPCLASPCLHLMPVPIAAAHKDGNRPLWTLDDLTRVLPAPALQQVRDSRYFLVENARTARAFIKAAGHLTPIAELTIVEIGHDPDPSSLDTWLNPLGTAQHPGIDAVVLSEAGCPGIADPGATLVARAHQKGIAVVPWVGPSAILMALMGSGLNGQSFRFHGYLSQDKDALLTSLRGLETDARRGETQIFMETPYRNTRLLESVLAQCAGDLRLCLAVDLSGPNALLQTRRIDQWCSQTTPDLHRKPAVFLLGR